LSQYLETLKTNKMNKLSNKFHEVLQHEGVMSIMSWGVEPHLVNTWNSFVVVTDDERILIPAYGFRKTQKNVEVNNKVKLRLAAKMFWDIKITPAQGFLWRALPLTLNRALNTI
jgi:hypothetical protein